MTFKTLGGSIPCIREVIIVQGPAKEIEAELENIRKSKEAYVCMRNYAEVCHNILPNTFCGMRLFRLDTEGTLRVNESPSDQDTFVLLATWSGEEGHAEFQNPDIPDSSMLPGILENDFWQNRVINPLEGHGASISSWTCHKTDIARHSKGEDVIASGFSYSSKGTVVAYVATQDPKYTTNKGKTTTTDDGDKDIVIFPGGWKWIPIGLPPLRLPAPHKLNPDPGSKDPGHHKGHDDNGNDDDGHDDDHEDQSKSTTSREECTTTEPPKCVKTISFISSEAGFTSPSPTSIEASSTEEVTESPSPEPTEDSKTPLELKPIVCEDEANLPGHADIREEDLKLSTDIFCASFFSRLHIHHMDSQNETVSDIIDIAGTSYFYSISWVGSCETTVDTQDPRKPLGDTGVSRTKLFVKSFKDCVNGGVGGYIDAGCLRYQFIGGI
ncbi:fc receptor [Trichoderma arundinaceum]|uniref:Fc receptor n=1 Tax=Trichoderma arundinaceum TaxID=490622 RepID=A0A395NQP9_TRIAR|nr:fc receptor [Trichoderma arundinaceum]